MRTLTAKQETARAGADSKHRGQGLFWLVKVSWSDPIGPEYYSMRVFSPDPAITPIPILEEVPGCPATLDIGVSGSPISGGTSLVLRNEPLSASGIETILQDAVSPEGTEVNVYLVFDPRDGSALAQSDWILVNSYQIDSGPPYAYGSSPNVSFSLIDRIESAGAKQIGRIISRTLFPSVNLPESSIGLMIPIIYGAVDGAQALPTAQGHVTELDGAIDVDNTTIFVKSVEGFPTAGGTIKIDSEPMTYTDVTAGTNASFNGVTRGPEPEEHSDGASVVEVLALYEYILTDHVNDDVSNTRVNGQAVTAAEVQRALGDKTATFLTLPELPTISEFSNVSQRTQFNGETSDWADDGSTVDSYIRSGGDFQLVANNATGAIDEEPGGVTFALFDPAEGKTALSVTHSNDLSGRTSFLTGLNLTITYQIIPGENLPEAVEDFPWDEWFARVTRDGVEIALSNIPKPSPLQIRGFLDRQAFFPGLEDSRFLFAGKGLGSISPAAMYLFSAGTGTLAVSFDNRVTYNSWPSYSGRAGGSPFVQSYSLVRTDGTPEPTRTGSAVVSSKSLKLYPAFDPEVFNITKLRAEIDVKGGGAAAGRATASIAIDGRATLSQTIDTPSSASEKRTIVLEYESPLIVEHDGTGDTLDSTNLITNLDFSTGSGIDENKTLVTSNTPGLFLAGTVVSEIIDDTSIKVLPPPQGITIGGSIILTNPFVRQSNPVSAIGPLEIIGLSNDTTTNAASKVFEARFWLDAIRYEYWSTDGIALVGQDTSLQSTETQIANALLASASGTFEHRIRLTAYARTEFSDPWDFFAEPQTIEIEAPDPVSSTRLIVSNIEWEAVEKPTVTRQLREREIVLTADVKGITDGGLLESPEAIITHLLEDVDDGWGLPSADIDGAGLTAALVGRENWKLARRISDVTTGKALLSEACRDSNVRYVQDGGKIRFNGNLFPGVEDVPATAAITRALIMPDLSKRAVHRDLIINDLRVNFKQDPAGFGFLEFYEDSRPQSTLGNAGALQTTIDAPWIGHRPTAEGLATRILNDSATPPQVIQLMTVAMWGVHLLATDVVSVIDAGSRTPLSPGVVIGRNNPGGQNCTFSILARQIKVRVWTAAADDTTYIDAYHGSRLIFVINGVKVAILDADAIFTLKGGLESAAVTGTQTEIIEKLSGPDRISFASDKGNFPPDRNQVGQLTSAGVLQVALFQANATLPSVPGGSPFTDYIVERNTGSAIAAVIFSADKEHLIANMALAVIEAGRFVYDPNI